MIHARDDYNRIQDPGLEDPSLVGEGSTPIGADEPVVLFRAQDKHMAEVLMFYRALVQGDAGQAQNWKEAFRIIDSIDQHVSRTTQWQRQNGCKSPDLPKETPATPKSPDSGVVSPPGYLTE